MNPRSASARRFVFGISIFVILTAINFVLFGYVRGEMGGRQWDYVQKTDDTILFGRVKLLEGGFIELTDAHTLIYTDHLQGELSGDQFRLESLNPKTAVISQMHSLEGVHIGPNEVRQWGRVPVDSQIGRQLEAVHKRLMPLNQ